MTTYRATTRVSVGGKVVRPGGCFEAEDDAALRALVARGYVEAVEESEPKAEPKPRTRRATR